MPGRPMVGAITHVAGHVGSRVLLAGVQVYRAMMSPRKGYRCAHALVHGESCSDFAVRALSADPVFIALPAIQSQFGACRATLLQLESGAMLDPALVQEIWRLMDSEGLRIAACETPVVPPP